MSKSKLVTAVRQVSPFARVIDLSGEIDTFTSDDLTNAFMSAVDEHVRTIIFNFSNVTYINSFGIGMLVMLNIRARRDKRKIAGYGLSQHYANLFKLARLDEVIPLSDTEEAALASTEPYDLPERES